MIQQKVYIEDAMSKKLVQENKRKIESEEIKKSSKVEKIKHHIKSISEMPFKDIIRRVSDRKQVMSLNMVEGNYKYNNTIEEGIYNIPDMAKIAVYTCIVGNYDTVRKPRYINPNIDYILFSDQDSADGLGWKNLDLRNYSFYEKYDSKTINRMIKILCHRFLKEYDYSLYIDGNIEIVGDLMPLICNMGDAVIGLHTHSERDCVFSEGKGVSVAGKAEPANVEKQLREYKLEGFPRHFGLFQNSIIIRNHLNCKLLMEAWWNEYLKQCTRDQLSLPYVIWKSGMMKDEIKVLGRDSEKNPRFYTYTHS